MEEKISIKKESVLNAYKQASEEQKTLLENMFGKDVFQPKNIIERVKTFEDACEILGDNHTLVKEYLGVEYNNVVITKNLIAYLKLRIICAALNEGWKPTFSDGECRYYPWFYIYNQNEYEKLNEDEKKKCRVVGRSNSSAYAHHASSYLSTRSGSQIAFKTRELSEYCAEQFIDIWADYLFG